MKLKKSDLQYTETGVFVVLNTSKTATPVRIPLPQYALDIIKTPVVGSDGKLIPGSSTSTSETQVLPNNPDKILNSVANQVSGFKTNHGGESPLQVDANNYNEGKDNAGKTSAIGAIVLAAVTRGVSTGSAAGGVAYAVMALLPNSNPENGQLVLPIKNVDIPYK